MTNSGEGDERRLPAARPAHEGVVLPADGSDPLIPGAPGAQAHTAPASGEPWGEPWGTRQPVQDTQDPQGVRPAQGGAWGQEPQYGYGVPSQPLPPAQPQVPPGGGAGQWGGPPPQSLPPSQPQPQPLPQSQPLPQPGGPHRQAQDLPGALPPGAAFSPTDATQYIPPVPSADGPGGPPPFGSTDATQFIPPVPQADDQDRATTFLGTGPLPSDGGVRGGGGMPGGGAVPPEAATQFLPPVPAGPSAGPPMPVGAPPGTSPGTSGERPPPAEFDSLFRTDGVGAPAPAGPYRADPTQHLPRVEGGPPPAGHQQPYQGDQYEDDEREDRRRKSSQMAVMGAVVVACAVLGLGVSAAMFGGGDDKQPDTTPRKNVAAPSPAPSGAGEPTESAAPDPERTQAEALDKLLADSNNSREAVIRSVENIKRCENLDQAADDLRGAAEQRRNLVTRLGELSVDKLPRNSELTASLTKAWQSSASADDHYAAWANQVKGKKGCRDGRARNTGQTAQANRASGDATKAKREASGLWNSIAADHGLTERRSEQL